MAYTKTNLNETTETVAVDMTAEDIENNETTETIAEQNARAYSKTVWNESTPITADKLNKIEDGIASALPLTGGTLKGNVVLNNDKAIGGKDTSGTVKWLTWVDKANNAQFGDIAIKSVINSNANPEVNVGGKGIYTLYHTGNKPTAAEIGALPLSGGTLTGGVISPYFETLSDFVVNRYGFSSFYTNNQEGAYIFCNKDNSSITLKNSSMVYGNPNGSIEIGPQNPSHCHIYTDRPSFYFNKDLIVYGNHVYHTGNKPTPSEIGAAASSHTHNYLPLTGGTVSGETVFTNYLSVKAWPNYGTGTAQLWYDGNNKLLNIQNAEGLKAGSHRVATWEGSNPTHHMFRYGSGLGGANGYITFSY